MSSKEKTKTGKSSSEINFSSIELEEIQKISKNYSLLYQKAMSVRKQIDESTKQLNELAQDMESLKKEENVFFQTIAANLNIEPMTVASAAANYILSQVR
jgi:DNA repair ATPase RecN